MKPISSPFLRAFAAWSLVPVFFAVAIAPLIISGWRNVTLAELALHVPALVAALCILAYHTARRP